MFSEAILQGFDSLTWNYTEDLNTALEVKSQEIDIIRKACIKIGIGAGFGFIEKENDLIYSSYLVIDKFGNDIAKYQRISAGWKVAEKVSDQYQEGSKIVIFELGTKKCSIGLCGDFWEDEVIEKHAKANTDITIWPVFIDYKKLEWEDSALYEYEQQAKRIGKQVVMINHISMNKTKSYGSAVYFKNGKALKMRNMGKQAILVIEL